MIDFSGYTAKAIEREMLAQVPADLDTREGSMIQTAIGPAAWYLEGLYMLLGQMQDNAYAETAVGESLDRIVWERGLERKLAVPAVRKGTFDVPVTSGSQFKTINGPDSVIFVAGDLLSSGDGGYVYAMACQTPGTIGNSYVGPLLPITAISGLTSALLGDILTAGTADEEDGALRVRYYETFNVPAFGGNIQAYRNAILAVEGVGAVQVYPAWGGGGTVLCSILDDHMGPALAATVQRVQYIICPAEDDGTAPSADGYGMAPIGAAVTITTATPLTIDVACGIEFAADIPNGAETYRSEIGQRIKEYLDTVTRSWGSPLKGHKVEYAVSVYVSRIVYAILTIEQVVNVTDVTVNGSGEDLHLIETADLQQVPVLGEVVINGG